MTVIELIHELSRFPADTKVHVSSLKQWENTRNYYDSTRDLPAVDCVKIGQGEPVIITKP